MNKKRLALGSSQGFTLIEVVLVLAIGGLIFLLAFIAFQQVSRNRRDTQRRSDAGRLIAELQNYYGDNGRYPTATGAGGLFVAGASGTADTQQVANFINSYMGGADFKPPSGGVPYSISATAPGAATTYDAVNATIALVPALKGAAMIYSLGSVCADTGLVSGGSNDIGIIVSLESGPVCRDSRSS